MNNIPEGFKLVPIVPTEQMIAATVAGKQGAWRLRADMASESYTAMLAAAPTPPPTIYDEAKELERCRAFWNQGHPLVAFGDLWTGWRARAMAGEDE